MEVFKVDDQCYVNLVNLSCPNVYTRDGNITLGLCLVLVTGDLQLIDRARQIELVARNTISGVVKPCKKKNLYITLASIGCLCFYLSISNTIVDETMYMTQFGQLYSTYNHVSIFSSLVP